MTTHVLITGHLHDNAIAMFQSNPSLHVEYAPDCTKDQLMKKIPSCHVLVTRSETDVTKEVIDQAKHLKVIARAAVGVGNIDIDYATRKGILVINTPGKNTNSAAELTFTLLLAMVRKVPQAHWHLKQGKWDRHQFTGRELRGKTIGIVGLGNVGHRVAKFARAFDMTVYAYDPYISPTLFERYDAISCHSLVELASKSQILSLHVPLNKETSGMIEREVLDALPKGAWLLNVARGGVVKEDLLLQYLESGHLAGVGIDTWETEPCPRSELVNHEAVWCTPHIGASTLEAQMAIGETIYYQVEKAIAGGVVDHPVNLPEVGIIDSPMLQSYAVLAEKLGAFIGQVLTSNPTRMEVQYRGDLARLEHGMIKLGFMKGYAGQVVDGFVSFVNAASHFDELGISLIEKSDLDFDSFKSAIKIVVHGLGGVMLSVGGVVFEDRYQRITLIDDFYFEVEPSGDLIVLENNDQPGVIGDVGHFLASRGINIDTFALSRNKKGGKAMALIRIDSALSSEQIKLMSQLKNVSLVRAVSL